MALNYIEHLCKSPSLHFNNYQFIVDANPGSRKLILDSISDHDSSALCLRTNLNGIDLNRQWPSGFSTQNKKPWSDTYPGTVPMSEEELKIVNSILYGTTNPDVLISVHSGRTSLAFQDILPEKDSYIVNNSYQLERGLVEDMKMKFDNDYCSLKERFGCESISFGALSNVIKYPISGSCVDYAKFEKKVPLTFALEIFEDSEKRQGSDTGLNCLKAFNPSKSKLNDVFESWNFLLDNLFLTLQDRSMFSRL
eukprot:GDKJ01023430.1.p1 GENE.GDKJ01023430.1~~GDKJ01023430.1.p1  ORF type:complete len:252 (+),score=21.24 GDKJ01023430.1:398-1153(+)